jgi:hypothetical protein
VKIFAKYLNSFNKFRSNKVAGEKLPGNFVQQKSLGGSADKFAAQSAEQTIEETGVFQHVHY